MVIRPALELEKQAQEPWNWDLMMQAGQFLVRRGVERWEVRVVPQAPSILQNQKKLQYKPSLVCQGFPPHLFCDVNIKKPLTYQLNGYDI